jgi:cytochrome c-type biogenesis protein CcmE
MTRKKRRLYAVGLSMLGLGTATALTLTAIGSGNISLYRTPTELVTGPALTASLRIGGLVEQGSVQRIGDGSTVAFRVTDLNNAVPVRYRGIVPDLFREGQGVVAEGRMGPDGVFIAREILARHDENYMPKEVADALKQSGQYRPGQESNKVQTP